MPDQKETAPPAEGRPNRDQNRGKTPRFLTLCTLALILTVIPVGLLYMDTFLGSVVEAPGEVLPLDRWEVRSWQKETLSEIPVQDGQLVEQGDLLAKYPTRTLTAERDRLLSEIDTAAATLHLAKERLKGIEGKRLEYEKPLAEIAVERSRVDLDFATKDLRSAVLLKGKGICSEFELKKAEAQKQKAALVLRQAQAKVSILESQIEDERGTVAKRRNEMEAEISVIEARIRGLKKELEHVAQELVSCDIRSPIAGRVVRITKQENELADKGELLFIVARGQEQELVIDVPDDQASHLATGQRVMVQSPMYARESDFEAEARTCYVSSMARERTGQAIYEVRAKLTASTHPLRIGSRVHARIVVKQPFYERWFAKGRGEPARVCSSRGHSR